MTTLKQDESFIATLISRSLLDDALEWIATNLEPEDVFTTRQLEEWAENNDYTKED